MPAAPTSNCSTWGRGQKRSFDPLLDWFVSAAASSFLFFFFAPWPGRAWPSADAARRDGQRPPRRARSRERGRLRRRRREGVPRKVAAIALEEEESNVPCRAGGLRKPLRKAAVPSRVGPVSCHRSGGVRADVTERASPLAQCLLANVI
ncbi:unnamed protein product [Prorocentrum cordatum]|uniref:Uncharacterized protein n=1 Tax=Prorocentrum cordatum TaxID=2364126 RepID=A0ABN9UUR7_9DINO|nr:unnamed protein product [Polarella glacialis]